MRLPPLVRRSDGVHRAAAIPWTKARATRRRQVSWLTGRRSMRTFPGPPGPVAASLGGSPRISLAAYSCRDSLGFGSVAPTPRSLLSSSRNTSAIMVRTRAMPLFECRGRSGRTEGSQRLPRKPGIRTLRCSPALQRPMPYCRRAARRYASSHCTNASNQWSLVLPCRRRSNPCPPCSYTCSSAAAPARRQAV